MSILVLTSTQFVTGGDVRENLIGEGRYFPYFVNSTRDLKNLEDSLFFTPFSCFDPRKSEFQSTTMKYLFVHFDDFKNTISVHFCVDHHLENFSTMSSFLVS